LPERALETALEGLPSPQRGEARRGETQEREGTGARSTPVGPLPTSPRWGEEGNASVKEALMKNLPL